MNETKAKKLIVASTVGAVLLLVVLLSVMIYQLVSINVMKKRSAYLDEKIAEYEVLIKDGEETFEARSLRIWIEREAKRLGYVYENK